MSKVLFQDSKGEDVVVLDLETCKVRIMDDVDLDGVAQRFVGCLEVAIGAWRQKKEKESDPFYRMIFQGGVSSVGAEAGNLVFRVGDGGDGKDSLRVNGGDVVIELGDGASCD